MSQPIIRTKVIPPRRRTDLLSRPRLLDVLQRQLERTLLLVVAPAGYGKTSLLIDLAHHTDLPVCWYAVDSFDDDPQRFFAHFIAALSHRFPEFGAESSAALQSLAAGQATQEQLLSILINELYEQVRKHFVLVIDDYHLVAECPDIDNFINRFVQQVAENCHLILASRRLVTLPDLPLLVARAQVGGIGFSDLAFQLDEIQQLLRENFAIALDDAEVQTLLDSTEGWITGVMLSTQIMSAAHTDQSRLMQAAGIDLYDYLAQQVLAQQEAHIRDFLLRTSLLGEFDAPLCAEVLAPLFEQADTDWQNLLDTLVARNLFVQPVGEHGAWLRYHHLFQEFLQKTIDTERPAEKSAILARMATVFSQRREWERAYQAYQGLNDPVATADFIERAGADLVARDQTRLLGRWLADLPPPLLAERPTLLSLRGCVETIAGQLETALDALQRAAAALEAADQRVALAETLSRRAVTHRLLGDYRATLHDADSALHLLDQLTEPERTTLAARYSALRAAALKARGLSLYLTGEADVAMDVLAEAAHAYEAAGDRPRAAMAAADMATMQMNAGQYAKAEEQFRHTLELWRSLSNVTRQAHVLNNLGVLYHLRGDFSQAQAALTEAIACARKCNHYGILAFALVSLGDLYVDMDDAERAEDAYTQAHVVAQQIEEHFVIFYLELAQAHLACTQHNWREAYNHLDAAGQLVLADVSDYEWGLYQIAMGRFYLSQQQNRRAIPPLHDAVHRLADDGQRVEQARARLLLAVAHQGLGEPDQALAHLAQNATEVGNLESWQPVVALGRYFADSLAALAQNTQAPVVLPNPAASVSAVDDAQRGIWYLETILERISRTAPNGAGPHRAPGHDTNSDSSAVATALPNAQTADEAESTELHVRTLGRIEVRWEGKAVSISDWQVQAARDLFLCFVAHPDGLTREEAAEILWPGVAPAQLKSRFKNTIYRLRKALQTDIVTFETDRYYFNRTVEYIYDAEQFEQIVQAARHSGSPCETKRLYQNALTLYGGDYLPELDALWVVSERGRLHRLYIEALLELSDLHLDQQEFAEALACVQQLLTTEPCMEAAHRLAMRIHAQSGNRAAVARQYEACMRVLREEIEAAPSEQTIELYNSLMQ